MRYLLCIIIALVFIFGISTIHFLNHPNSLIAGINTSSVEGLYQGKSIMGEKVTLVIAPDAKVTLSYETEEKIPRIQTGTWKMLDEKLEIMLLTNGRDPYPLPIQLLFEKNGDSLITPPSTSQQSLTLTQIF